MRWQGRARSRNVQDRRRMRAAGVGGGIGLVGIVVALVAVFLGADPGQVLRLVGGGGGGAPAGEVRAGVDESADDPDGTLDEFAAVVLKDTEDVWSALLAEEGLRYDEPTLVLFRDAVASACGTQSSAVGPFYCPADASIYLDLGFFDQLDRRLGAPGDFAQAYVLAHEVGHHVQSLLGTSARVHEQRAGASEAEANRLSVRLELQADYYAGVWAHHADRSLDVLDPGDLDEALNAASSIGDDLLQRRAGGRVVPDSFTHGTSEQRARWFRRGYERGDLAGGDTFAVPAREL